LKRFLCLSLALLLLIPVLLLPAAAAERKEYVFEYVEPVATYSNDYEFSDFKWNALFCDEIPPNGVYRLSFVFNGVPYITFPFELNLGPDLECPYEISLGDWDDSIHGLDHDFLLSFSKGDVNAYGYPFYFRVVYYDENGELWTSLYFSLKDFSSVKLIPYDPIFDSLTGAFSADPHALLSHVLSLLPIVLPVVVGFIGIRKAVAWLRSKLSEA